MGSGVFFVVLRGYIIDSLRGDNKIALNRAAAAEAAARASFEKKRSKKVDFARAPVTEFTSHFLLNQCTVLHYFSQQKCGM